MCDVTNLAKFEAARGKTKWEIRCARLSLLNCAVSKQEAGEAPGMLHLDELNMRISAANINTYGKRITCYCILSLRQNNITIHDVAEHWGAQS